MILGAHAPGGPTKAIGVGVELDCDSIQVFTSNPSRWAPTEITEEVAEKFREDWAASSIGTIFSHDSYLINIASPKPKILHQSRRALTFEIERCAKLGITYVNMHPGAHVGEGEDEGLRILVESLNVVLDKTAHTEVSILLETTAGQGTNLGYRFEHLRYAMDGVGQSERIGVCIDTCHIFAAGYAIHTEEGYAKTYEQFDEIIGLEHVKMFHVNDAKSAFESRVDRHENIGQGNIGLEPFRWLMNDRRFAEVPMILETPKPEKMHAVDLKLLRDLQE